MAFTAGVGNIKLKYIDTITLDDGAAYINEIDGCDIETGVNLTIADGEMITLACGTTQEISEKVTLNFVYLPDTAAEGALIEQANAMQCRVTIIFSTGEHLSLNNIPFSLVTVNKQIVAGQVAKYNVSCDVSKANIDEILSYSA